MAVVLRFFGKTCAQYRIRSIFLFMITGFYPIQILLSENKFKSELYKWAN